MATINLGKIQPLWRGEYTDLETYRPLDFVLYLSQTYLNILEAPANSGILPSNTTYYVPLVGELAINTVVQYVVSQLANGEETAVAIISEGLLADDYRFFINSGDLRVYERGSVTGTFSTPLDFDPDTGIDSGLSGAIPQVNAITEGRVAVIESDVSILQGGVSQAQSDISENSTNMSNALGKMGQSFTADATFTSTDNVIVMNGIVAAFDLEIGDVIQYSNANVNNNKARTVESITDGNTIVVNYEHCGSRGNGSLKLTDETVTGATVKLLAKHSVARDGLGQDWVDVSSIIQKGVLRGYIDNREMAFLGNLYFSNGNMILTNGRATVTNHL